MYTRFFSPFIVSGYIFLVLGGSSITKFVSSSFSKLTRHILYYLSTGAKKSRSTWFSAYYPVAMVTNLIICLFMMVGISIF